MKRNLAAIALLSLALLMMIFGASCTSKPPAPPPPGDNLIANGDFELGQYGEDEYWAAWGSTSEGAEGVSISIKDSHSDFTGKCLHLTATNFGSALQSVQLTKQYSADDSWVVFNLAAGSYTVKFRAVASENSTIKVLLQTKGYDWRWNRDFNITTDVTDFSYTFDLDESQAADPVALLFCFGNNAADTEFHIDDIEFFANS